MRKVVLPNSLRLFKAVGQDRVDRVGKYLDAGEEILVGEVELRTYEDEECAVAPFFYGGKKYFLILQESGLIGMLAH